MSNITSATIALNKSALVNDKLMGYNYPWLDSAAATRYGSVLARRYNVNYLLTAFNTVVFY